MNPSYDKNYCICLGNPPHYHIILGQLITSRTLIDAKSSPNVSSLSIAQTSLKSLFNFIAFGVAGAFQPLTSSTLLPHLRRVLACNFLSTCIRSGNSEDDNRRYPSSTLSNMVFFYLS